MLAALRPHYRNIPISVIDPKRTWGMLCEKLYIEQVGHLKKSSKILRNLQLVSRPVINLVSWPEFWRQESI
jgi:hypothetical protein